MSSVLSHLFGLSIARLGLLLVSGDKRDAEILALRHQILVLQRQIDRPRFTPNAPTNAVLKLDHILTATGEHNNGPNPRRHSLVLTVTQTRDIAIAEIGDLIVTVSQQEQLRHTSNPDHLVHPRRPVTEALLR